MALKIKITFKNGLTTVASVHGIDPAPSVDMSAPTIASTEAYLGGLLGLTAKIKIETEGPG